MPEAPATFDSGVRPEDLDPERPRPLVTPWGEFALYTVEGRVVAAQSFCPHMDGPLFEGSLAGDAMTCPWHSWRFSLTSGACLDAGTQDCTEIGLLARCPVSVGPNGTFVLGRPT